MKISRIPFIARNPGDFISFIWGSTTQFGKGELCGAARYFITFRA